MRSDLEKLVARWRERHALLRGYRGFSAGEAFALREVADELDALLRASGDGWQPIETAPLGGLFLGTSLGDFGPEVYGVIRGPFGDFKLAADPEWEVDPTHWMEIPMPPAAQRADQAEDA